ncbi:hypothetical protein [Streptosporangium sp. NPDC051022]|uniref:hypothetical protein n=1 Tax=Streptosporangium sp. NPDC051022 TaxID=3155752 RepID=UPI0034280FB4
MPAGQCVTPFVAALAEPAEFQAARQAVGGGFVTMPKWVRVLERHFPAQES